MGPIQVHQICILIASAWYFDGIKHRQAWIFILKYFCIKKFSAWGVIKCSQLILSQILEIWGIFNKTKDKKFIWHVFIVFIISLELELYKHQKIYHSTQTLAM